jgi:photoactive yellow protein
MSIMVDGDLWGLVACHHRRPTQLPLRMRQTCAALAIGAGSLVAWQSQRHRVDAARQAAAIQSHIVAAFNQVEVPLAETVEASAAALLRLAGATAGALWHRGELISFGRWPHGEAGQRILDFSARTLETTNDDVSAFDALGPLLPLAPVDLETVTGCMVVRLGDFAASGLVWVRPEYRQEVTWGGNPDKPVQLAIDPSGAAVLSPRASFARWETLVRGRCRQWTDTDIAAAHSILPLRQMLAVRDSLVEVRESDRRFRALLDLQSDAYWQLDAAGRVVTLSKPLPIDIGPVGDRRLPELFEPFCSAETIGAMRQALASAEPFRDLRLSSKSHEESDEFELLLSGDPLRDRHFRVIGFHGTLTDVTQALKVGRELRLREAAEMANRTKSTFLSHVSHELRTPLNAVLGFSQMLLVDASASPAQRKQAEHIHKAGQWLLAMISDLLDVARIEAGKPNIDLRPTEVGPLIEQAIEQLQDEAQAKTVQVGFEASRKPAWASADPKRLRQVLVNLISNAIKYNRQGGSVVVAVTHIDAEGLVAVAVRDSGSGLDAEQLGHIFEPFNRLGRESQDIHGSGIGLVIAKRLVDAMGGRIEVDSQPQAGSCFTVILPAAEPADSSRAASHHEPPDPDVLNRTAPQRPSAIARPAKAGLVLYVEDEPTNAELMRAIVASCTTARIAIASTAEEALTLARETRPDLMLIDINLPGEDGAWLLKAVRQDAVLRDTFCIAVTADAMQDTLFKLRLQGFDQCWHKPVDLRWSGRAIQAVLDTVALGGRATRLAFDDPQAFAVLAHAADPWLDTLDFGVIKLDPRGVVTAYNLRESLLSGYEPTAVVGREFFKDIGPCMNNPQVAGRFEGVELLDATVETVFRMRLRRIPVRLRLLKHAPWPQRYLLVDRLDALAGG